MLDPVREPQAALDEMRRAIGTMQFSAQYMQESMPPESNLMHREWLRYYDEEPAEVGAFVATWDTASALNETSSYSVGMLWGSVGGDYYLLDVVRDRFETPDLRRVMIECHRAWQPDATLVEDTELRRSLMQDFRRRENWRILLRRPRYDKEARLCAQLARFEAGQVHLPRNAPFLAAYEHELLGFPRSEYTDQVDATSQVLDYFSSLVPRERPLERRNIRRRNIVRRSAVRSA